MKSLLYIDMAYTVQAMRERRQESFWQARHSGGYFRRVWGVHPMADLVESGIQATEIHRLSPQQITIQGRAFGCQLPKLLMPINFLISQTSLLLSLYRRIRHRGISLVFTTDALYSGVFGYIMSRLLNCPLVVAVYGNWDEVYADTKGLAMPRLIPSLHLQNLVTGFILSRADHVVAPNQNNLDYVLAHGAKENKSSIVSNAKFLHDAHFTDPDQRRQSTIVLESLGLPLDAKILAYVGRLVVEKLPNEALEAMMLAAERDPSIVGVLAGEGEMRAQLERRIAERNMSHRIKLTGNLSQEALAALLPHCIVVSPLTGLALFEAALAGAPIVGYRRDWQAELIEDGVDGFLVDANDIQTLGQRALDISQDSKIAVQFSRAIRARAMAIADKRLIFVQEHALYDNLIKMRGAQAAGQ